MDLDNTDDGDGEGDPQGSQASHDTQSGESQTTQPGGATDDDNEDDDNDDYCYNNYDSNSVELGSLGISDSDNLDSGEDAGHESYGTGEP